MLMPRYFGVSYPDIRCGGSSGSQVSGYPVMQLVHNRRHKSTRIEAEVSSKFSLLGMYKLTARPPHIHFGQSGVGTFVHE